MPTDPHLIPKLPRDAGAAQKIMDVAKQTHNVAKQYGVFGNGVRVTGGMIETASSGQRIYMQSSVYGTPGLYCTDVAGTTVVASIIPGTGITLLGGGAGAWTTQNEITWVIPSSFGSVFIAGYGSTTSNTLEIDVYSQSNVNRSVMTLSTNNTAGSSLASFSVAGAFFAFWGDGRTVLPGGLGLWYHAAPAAQPAAPTTLAQVIAALQAYGITA